MALVYRAWDRVTQRDVAVKVLRREFSADEDFIRRFNKRSAAAKQMSHPNIVGMYDVGQDGDARYNRDGVRGRAHAQGGHPPARPAGPKFCGKDTLRILAAVDHAHRNHIVHRDINPEHPAWIPPAP
jgi:serine/threonine-protein kinase